MCQFCETLKDKTKDIKWRVRSTYAEDNICEYVNDEECSCCDGCISHFKLVNYEMEGNTRISIEFCQKLKDNQGNEVIIEPFSEPIQWNYCPICGEQISKTVSNDICLGYKMDIVNKED